MGSTTRIRWCGLLAMVGGAIWTVAWTLNLLTEEGSKTVLGLRERGWSALLAPAMLFFMAGLVGLYARHKGQPGKLLKAGFVTTFASLATMLGGNVLEWWVKDLIYPPGQENFRLGSRGWGFFWWGFMIQPIGLVLFGMATLRAIEVSRWRKTLPLAFGSTWVVFILIGITLALLSIGGQRVFGTWFFTPGVVWAALGYALWSERGTEE